MNAQDCIVTRRSVRKFTAQPVAHETLEKVVEGIRELLKKQRKILEG